jgi:TatD DNase family protein
MLVDSHCHLDFSEFDATLDTVIRDAHAADVRYMLAISARRSQLDKVRQITRDNDGIFFAAGTHPLHIQEEIPYNVEELQAMATDDKMIAIGETGLDFHYKKDTAEQQFSSFLNHIKAAQTTNLPLVIHARNADDAMGDILKKEYQRKPFAFVLHCFSSEKRLAEIAVAVYFSSFLCNVLYKSGLVASSSHRSRSKIGAVCLDKNTINWYNFGKNLPNIIAFAECHNPRH